jgi:hypothetical protein
MRSRHRRYWPARSRSCKYDRLLVYRLDKFSRRIRDLATLMDELDAAGVHFRSATEPFREHRGGYAEALSSVYGHDLLASALENGTRGT